MYAAILILSGINFLSSEITMFEQISTAVVDSPIPIPLTTPVVTASVGHMPRNKTKDGFSCKRPLRKAFI